MINFYKRNCYVSEVRPRVDVKLNYNFYILNSYIVKLANLPVFIQSSPLFSEVTTENLSDENRLAGIKTVSSLECLSSKIDKSSQLMLS